VFITEKKCVYCSVRTAYLTVIQVDNTLIYTLKFADDQVVMAQGKEHLEYMCRKLQEEYSKWGLNMNIAKTKYMSLSTDTNYLEVDNGDITGF
jgi:hypothetical protein